MPDAAAAPAPPPGRSRLNALLKDSLRHWCPPKRLNLSEWADENYYLSAESAATPGRWKTIPYQRGIMNAITDPETERVTLIKSARVGATKMMGAAIGYYMHQDPCPIMIVQPTVEDAEGYSKEEIAPMLRDVPVLAGLVLEPRSKNSSNTILHKKFRGGVLSMVGANSPRGFRRTSRKLLLCDEADGYPNSAGSEGDPISLATRRTEFYWDRKIVIASTPGLAGASRVEEQYKAGDERRFYVPCPQCQHMDYLVFRQGTAGHWMAWPEGKPEEAHFVCSKNGCVIEHKSKREMVAAGEWRAAKPFKGHASFHIWAAYSYSPNATWGHIAAEFLAANKAGPEQLKTFVNTALGETWQERGDAPEWRKLYDRRAMYPIGTVPEGVVFLTAGVDVQRDRLVYEIVGWGVNRQSWSIDAGVLPGDTSSTEVWGKLDELLAHQWPNAAGIGFPILKLAIDSGYNTQTVYNWARRHPMSRVLATKGVATASILIGLPSPVDVTMGGKKLKRGYKVWPIGVNVAKSEFYGWLRQEPPAEAGAPWPLGFCHFPMYGEDYFLQLTAEHLVPVKKRTGHVAFEWQLIAGRENHFLDCRLLARAAASLEGLDRLSAKKRARIRGNPRLPKPPVALDATGAAAAPVRAPAAPGAAAAPPPPLDAIAPREPRRSSEPKRGGWLAGGSRGTGGRGNWLGKRR